MLGLLSVVSLFGMITVAEVEKLALDLPEADRAALASTLLRSLPIGDEEDDEGIAEALRREAQLEANPDLAITFEQFEENLKLRRK